MDGRNPSVVPGTDLKLCCSGCQSCVAADVSPVSLSDTDCISQRHRGPRAQFSILCLVSSGLCLLKP